MSAPPASERRTATLVLLSLDEREALEALLPRVPLDLFDRVLALDGGSTDGTLDLYRERSIPVVVQPPDRKGRGNAFLIARDAVETDDVVLFSADGNEDPGDLPRMLEHLRAGADMVIGGRFVLRGSRTDVSDDPLRLRKAGAIAFGLLARIVFGSRAWDATNGYRGFRVASMKRLGLDAPGHEIEYQATIRATKLGQRVVEIPSRELDRAGGERKPTAGTWKLGWCTLKCLVREIRLGRRFQGG